MVRKDVTVLNFQLSLQPKMSVRPLVSPLVSLSIQKFWKTALTIFLIFGMKLGDNKPRKVTEPDFSKKISLAQIWAKRAQNGPKSRFFIFFCKTALTIFLILCMKLGDYKGYHSAKKTFSGKISFGPNWARNGPNGPEIYVVDYNFRNV